MMKIYRDIYSTAERHQPLYHKIVFYFTLSFAIYTLFGRFTWLHGLVEHTINSFVYVFVACFGFFLFAIDLFFYKNYKKLPGYKLSAVFILCALISSALNMRYGVSSNISTLVWLTVQMGLRDISCQKNGTTDGSPCSFPSGAPYGDSPLPCRCISSSLCADISFP